jgi:osmotically-inducible protein OsmY
MKVKSILAVTVCVAVLATAGESRAQGLFRDSSGARGAIQAPRSMGGLGGSIATPRDGGASTKMDETAESIGQLTGGERFLRGSRAAGDFVGTDSGDRAGFVGSATADNSGPIQSATTGALVRTTTGPAINRTRVRSPAPYMYEARLRIGFDVNPQSLPMRKTKVDQRLMQARAIDPASSIEVQLEGSTAILRGTVGSGREKNLAEMLLMFEPGISNVKNELVVRPPSRVPARSPSDSGPPKDGDS